MLFILPSGFSALDNHKNVPKGTTLCTTLYPKFQEHIYLIRFVADYGDVMNTFIAMDTRCDDEKYLF